MKDNTLKTKLAYDDTFACVQCGYCLPVCPTYLTLGKETHSPRGRINLVKLVAEGKLELEDIADSIDLCLGCRACETACPTNVSYGKILNSAVHALSESKHKQRSIKGTITRKMIFKHTLPQRRVLHTLRSGLALYQKSKLDKVLRKVGAAKILPKAIRRLESVTPAINQPSPARKKERAPSQTPRFRVGFFIGCVMDTFFARVNDLSMQLLQTAGCEVVLIQEQTCCGALHQHSGEREAAIELAQSNIQAFEQQNLNFIINSIGGCGASLIEYPHLFQEDSDWYPRAKRFAEKCKDISVLLDQLELPFKRTIMKRVTYQPSCHLQNVQKVVKEPIALIKKIPGITYLPHSAMKMCCGSAGIYNIIHHEEAMQILAQTMDAVKAVQPEAVITTNPGCHLQLKIGVQEEGLTESVKVVHLVELLAEACDIR